MLRVRARDMVLVVCCTGRWVNGDSVVAVTENAKLVIECVSGSGKCAQFATWVRHRIRELQLLGLQCRVITWHTHGEQKWQLSAELLASMSMVECEVQFLKQRQKVERSHRNKRI